ncbi:NAD(P)/FAD-dependent oxidoreductase [Paractinoplanes durhamensis]|uniref:FAD dependent oxidoreductase domain-containing protein n=1 Tax=Paractinoplanes durhamensis TaxID=113563 RepID=A0ABQ3YQV0_9ACTN|nr:FAD-dependent oxidoreductase [Actinoplanes durhamensis]GID99901.1 hypothetical protein Adu01nite_12520 [Actinoplanes durhamensis]
MKPVVVVGTGIVGASIAYHLARLGEPVVAVGRDAGVTAASFGWIGGDERGDWPGGAADLAGSVLGDWRRLAAEVPGVGVRWTGSLRWPVTGAGGPDVDDVRVGGPYQVGAAAIGSLEPHLRALPDRAIYAPEDGGVDPAGAARALLIAARGLGAHVVSGVTVRGMRTGGVETSAGFLPASVVVLAAGAGTVRLASLSPSRGEARLGATSPALLIRVRARHAGLVRGIVATPGLEVREVRDRDLLIAAALAPGGRWSWSEQRELAAKALHELETTFDGPPPRLAGWRVGVRPMPGGGPIIGPLTPDVYAAVMHSGVCLAPTVGRLVATEIVSGAAAPSLARCRPLSAAHPDAQG